MESTFGRIKTRSEPANLGSSYKVKQRPTQKVSAQEVRELVGVLRDGENGLFVGSGGFTSEALSEMRRANSHVESVDLDAMIDLWTDHYEQLAQDDKALMRLRKIWFLAPED